MSTQIAAAPPATALPVAPAGPARSAASPAPPRAGRSGTLRTVVIAALGLVSGALLVWQLGPVDLVTGLADAAPAGTLSAWAPRSWRSRARRSATVLTGALPEVRPPPYPAAGQHGRLAAGIGGSLLIAAGCPSTRRSSTAQPRTGCEGPSAGSPRPCSAGVTTSDERGSFGFSSRNPPGRGRHRDTGGPAAAQCGEVAPERHACSRAGGRRQRDHDGQRHQVGRRHQQCDRSSRSSRFAQPAVTITTLVCGSADVLDGNDEPSY